MSYTLAEIVERLGGELRGSGAVTIRQVAALDTAGADEIGFVAQPKYFSRLAQTRAGAVILPLDAEDATSLPRILVAHPYLYFAKVGNLLNPRICPTPGVHPAAVVAGSAHIATDASIGAGAVIGDGAVIGARTIVGANSVVGDRTRIGEDCLLYAHVTLYHNCVVGNRVIMHSNSVIGADGFGFAPDGERWEKIPQLGRVLIADDVEIGAGTTVDRGALGDTVIGEGVKLDNQIQVAHNVTIGAHTAIAACTGIAGSAKIGRNCQIGGAAMIAGHIEIVDGTRISTNTLITKSLTVPGTYTSALPFLPHESWLRNAVHLRNLDRWADRLKRVETRLAELDKGGNDKMDDNK